MLAGRLILSPGKQARVLRAFCFVSVARLRHVFGVVTLATVMDEFVKAQFVDLVSLFVPPQRTVRLHVGKINL